MEGHRQVTINGGLRFDEMWQFVDANQLSRASASPTHRSSTPSSTPGMRATSHRRCSWRQLQVNIGLVSNTTAAVPTDQGNSPVLPERAHYFDAGVDQNIPFGCSKPAAKDCTDLDLGVDVYYKIATDLIDNGLFGQALRAERFQLRPGHQRGRRVQRKIPHGNFQPTPTWLSPSREQLIRYRTNIYSATRHWPISAA